MFKAGRLFIAYKILQWNMSLMETNSEVNKDGTHHILVYVDDDINLVAEEIRTVKI